MKHITKIIVWSVCFQIGLGSAAPNLAQAKMARTAPESKISFSALKYLDAYASHAPEEIQAVDDISTRAVGTIEAKEEFENTKRELIQALKKAKTREEIVAVKRRIANGIAAEAGLQSLQHRAIIENMTMGQLDAYRDEIIERGQVDDNQMESLIRYPTLYTKSEKATVIYDIVAEEFKQVVSTQVYELGRTSPQKLIEQMEVADRFVQNKRLKWQHKLAIAISVIAAGSLSWILITSARKKWDRRTRQMEEDYKNKTTAAEQKHVTDLQQARDDFAQRIKSAKDNQDTRMENEKNGHQKRMTDEDAAQVKRLADEAAAQDKRIKDQNAYNTNEVGKINDLFDIRARLREDGYVWTVCSVKTVTKTAFCAYDQKNYTGTERCASYCLKHPVTGRVAPEVAEQSLICSNEGIPNNCGKTNAYLWGKGVGYTDGYKKGYDTQYDIQYKSNYTSSYNEFSKIGEVDGRKDGYNDGYDDGYRQGRKDGDYDSDQTYSKGYNKGKSDGSAKGKSEGTSDGSSDGRSDGDYDGRIYGKSKGESDGKYYGNADGKEDGFADGKSDGYSDGYADGYAYARSGG